MIRNKWICLLMLLGLVCFQSCKKGCPDPKAFNYEKGAKENDGSCLYCDSSTMLYNSSYAYVSDYNNSSPYYGQQVLYISVAQNLKFYTGNGCKSLGKINYDYNNGGCTNFFYTAYLYNQTGATLVYSDNLLITPYTIGTFTYHVSGATIPPYGTDTISLGFNCSQYSGFSLQTVNPVLQYH